MPRPIRRLGAAALLAACLLLTAGGTGGTASAHELLPKDLVEYMQAHPDATAEELEAYMDANATVYGGDQAYKVQLIESAKNPDYGLWHTSLDFVRLGLIHIFSGVDHVLFVLSLLLVYVSLRKTLKLISFFTVAHCTSLILAGSGLVNADPRVVEPVIAFSIAYVAVTSVFLRHKPFFGSQHNKTLMVFVFGLFHGLGFAGALTELSIPKGIFVPVLLSFNVGIELGQICIIACALPFILLYRGKPWYGGAIKGFAVLITLAAIVFMVQRIAPLL